MTKRHKIIPNVIGWTTLGGVAGQVIGLSYALPSPLPKLLFTAMAGAFGAALAISRWKLNASPIEDLGRPSLRRIMLYLVIGVVGGYIAAQFGSGINLVAFIVLTLAFGLNEKVGIPTTVIVMAINAVVWFMLHLIFRGGFVIDASQIPLHAEHSAADHLARVATLESDTWKYWLAAVPVVSMGAPLGAWAASKVKRDVLIIFLLVLIAVEVLSTAVILGPKLSPAHLLISFGTIVLCAGWFWVMHQYRKKTRPQDFA